MPVCRDFGACYRYPGGQNQCVALHYETPHSPSKTPGTLLLAPSTSNVPFWCSSNAMGEILANAEVSTF